MERRYSFLIRSRLSLVLFTVLFIVTSTQVGAANKPPSKKDLERLQQEINSAERKLNQQQNKSHSLEKRLRKTETDLGTLKRKIRHLQSTINEQQTQLKSLHTKQQVLQARSKEQQAEIANLITTSYRLGREKRIKVLLNQEDPEKFSRSLIYADYLNQAHLSAIDAYRQTADELERIKPVLQAKTQALLNNKTALLDQQTSLKKTLNNRQATLAALTKSINSDKDQLSKLKRERKELEALLKAVEKTVTSIQLPSDTIPFAKTKGKLPRPIRGQLKNRYGKKRGKSGLRWQGIAFYAPPGRDVTSVHYGRVVFADWFKGKGLLMIIDHGDGYMTLYAHNQSLLREPGDWVSAGETIATTGNSGGLDHTELYFEIRHQGEAVNPMYWLR